MGKGLRLGLLIAGILLLSGFIYWQFIKKGVINKAITSAVSDGTDNTYFVKYESSRIDEVAGNASFSNLVLQSDSLQEQLYNDDTASIAREIFNIKLAELNITGANIPSLLRKNTVTARKIELIQPVIRIVRTGKKGNAELTKEDSLALYDRITGKFKSIQADEIIVKDGTLDFSNGKAEPHTILKGINIHLKNLKIDSTRNYDNILSYFIKDIDATVQSLTSINEKTGNQFQMEGLQYNAPGRFIKVNNILQKDPKTGEVLTSLKGNSVTGISTNDFIIHRRIKADSISSNGGTVSIYRNIKTGNTHEELEIGNEFFDEVMVKNIRLGSSSLHIYNKAKKEVPPLKIQHFRAAVNDINDEAKTGTNLARLIGNSKWSFSGDGLNFNTDDNYYKVAVGSFNVNNATSFLRLNKISVKPLLSRAAFMKQQKFQLDQYDLEFNNILLTGINAKALMNEQKLFADNASLQPVLKVYNDRTLAFDTTSKVGLYPHQLLYDLKIPVKVKTVNIRNGHVSYTERGRISTQSGDVFFSNINGTIYNLSNVKEELKNNNTLTLNATAKFMGIAPIKTNWKLPVDTKNGAFTVSGEIAGFDATKINTITRPLGMANIEDGQVKNVRFTMTGDDYRSKGNMVILYDNLKVKLLKNTGDGKARIREKSLTSFIANLFMMDHNPMNGQTRKVDMAFDRDTKKSFFNLIWKTLFQGTKRITKGKNDG
jgi:hypothetical protein